MATNFYDKASLVMIQSGYKAGTVYSVKPDDGTGDFTFARTTTGTRTNSAGLIEEMAIDVPRLQYPTCPSLLLEPSRTNSALWSEQLDNAYWDELGSTTTPDQTTAPDGLATADLLQEDNSTGLHYKRRTSITVVNGQNYYSSCYFKYAGRQFVYMQSLGASTYFDIVNGVITSQTSPDAGIEDVGNGWFRCWVDYGVTASTSLNFSIILSDDGTTTSYTGDGVSGVYVWGIQVEQGTYPTTYIKTEAATTNRGIDTCSVADLVVNGILSATEGTIAEQYDADKYAYRYTSDGNMETYKNGVSEGSVVQAVPTTYNLKNPAKYVELTMYNSPLTDEEMIEITT